MFHSFALLFRIKRTVPSRDSYRSFGHALRVRRDGIDADADDNDVEKFADDENVDWEAFHGNQVNTEISNLTR